jgi:hypothetical protein
MRKIFVFGSNLAGIHGAGAAKHAHDNLGAEWGIGEGLTGECYALPTKDERIHTRPLIDVKISVVRMLGFARFNPYLLFYVTPIGTGLAGFTKTQIKSCFTGRNITENVVFSKEWFSEEWT